MLPPSRCPEWSSWQSAQDRSSWPWRRSNSSRPRAMKGRSRSSSPAVIGMPRDW